MIARVDNDPALALKAITLHSHHPFQPMASFAFESIHTSWKRYNVGAVVTNGETGVASAAMDVAALKFIPVTGFAQRGKENESGNMKEHYRALLLEPGDRFSILDHSEADSEMLKHAPYARHSLRREADELNARYSDAVVVMLAGHTAINEWVDNERIQALRRAHPTFVCDLSSDCSMQALRLQEFLAERKPWFLTITGARESASEMTGYGIYDRAAAILHDVLLESWRS
jgi:hypothetical protein